MEGISPMFRTTESRLLLLTLGISALIYFAEAQAFPLPGELRALAGVFLAFGPVGYLFTSALFPRGFLSLPEKTALALFSSYAVVSTGYFLTSQFLGYRFTFIHTLTLVFSLSLVFYMAYLLRFHLKHNPVFRRLKARMGE